MVLICELTITTALTLASENFGKKIFENLRASGSLPYKLLDYFLAFSPLASLCLI